VRPVLQCSDVKRADTPQPLTLFVPYLTRSDGRSEYPLLSSKIQEARMADLSYNAQPTFVHLA
jgi:hypothetical protein